MRKTAGLQDLLFKQKTVQVFCFFCKKKFYQLQFLQVDSWNGRHAFILVTHFSLFTFRFSHVLIIVLMKI